MPRVHLKTHPFEQELNSHSSGTLLADLSSQATTSPSPRIGRSKHKNPTEPKMKHLLSTTIAFVGLATLVPLGGVVHASPPPPPKFVKLLASSGPSTVKMGKVVTLRVSAGGVKLSVTHLGKQPRGNEAHFQI